MCWASLGSTIQQSSDQGEGGTAMITSEEARRIIAAAEQKAQEIGQPMNIAVVDAGRNLKAFSRMEDAWLGSIAISIDKAFTSASFSPVSEKNSSGKFGE
jgi:uncharacterized protein GlcG (DUF336 family)